MSLAAKLQPHLSYLRRYARALTGDQKSGDTFVKATLAAIVAEPELFSTDLSAHVQLYKIFGSIWNTANIDIAPEDGGMSGLRKIAPINRQILLLISLESFTIAEVSQIVGLSESEVEDHMKQAIKDIDLEARAEVLIIEDETLISMELEQIVTQLGHIVSGTATTHSDAVKAADDHKPTLILADIQLADGSSGIDAVKDILDQFAVPVIFVTAFPERLLTGERPEPTFLVTKPFQPNAIRAAISQALFFA